MNKKELKEYIETEIVIYRAISKGCRKDKLFHASAMWLGKIIALKELGKKFKLGIEEKK